MAEAPTRPPSTEPALPLDVHEVSSALLEDGTYSPAKLHYPSDTPVESASNQWVEPQAEPKGDKADKLLVEVISPFSAGTGMSDTTKALKLASLSEEELQTERRTFYELKYCKFRENLGPPSPVKPLPEGHAKIYLPAPPPESPEPSTVEPLLEDISPFSEEGEEKSDITNAMEKIDITGLPQKIILQMREFSNIEDARNHLHEWYESQYVEYRETEHTEMYFTGATTTADLLMVQSPSPKSADPSVVHVVQSPPPKTSEHS
jgi:hypothetical protein